MHSDVLDTLYRKYYNATYLYTLSLCKNHELAEDITSDAFVKAFLTIDDGKRDFQFWLFSVCKHLFIDHLRKNKKKTFIVFDESTFASFETNVEASILQKERDRLIYQTILELKANYREALVLHYFAGIQVKEIAILIGISLSNTKVMLHRARLNLKRRLEEKGYEF